MAHTTLRTDPGQRTFDAGLEALRAGQPGPHVTLEEIPAPRRVAPYAVALQAEVTNQQEELATGRFIVLHDPSVPEAWDGAWRVVTFAQAALEPDLAGDPLLNEVGWSWLKDTLAECGVGYHCLGGTVTSIVSEGFGDLADKPASIDLEVRASWTPDDPAELGRHLEAWSAALCTVAGLPPVPEGVVSLPGRRR